MQSMHDNLRLWVFRTSPYSGKARAAFAEKGVPVELVEIHPGKRPARLRELNPANRVPVLQVGDIPIRESSLICEWLEETHPDPPLWPADPELRGWARGWAKYIDDTVTADFFLGMRKMAFGKADDDPEDIVERLHAKVPRRWPVLEAALGTHDGPWLCGEQFTYADLSALAPAVRLPEWAQQLLPDPGEHPRVTAWLEALRARPSAAAIDTKGEPVAA
jgi:glutathione S-transferase